MKDKTPVQIPVMHVMRTYGMHGGEQQLSQYLGAHPKGNIEESFAFVYQDPQCAELFRTRSPRVAILNLIPWSIQTGGAWKELTLLLPLLPWLALRFAWVTLKQQSVICVVHGFQAALVAWPTALLMRHVRWIYVHRITKSSTGSNRLFRIIYKPYDVVAGNSKAVTASLRPLVNGAQLETLENGLDWRKFDKRSQSLQSNLPIVNGPVLVTIGRLLPHKGQNLLIEALELLDNQFGNVALWIVGEGAEMESLRLRAYKSLARDRIHFLGHRKDVPAILKKADIFVNASTWEGMSNAVLEGMAASLPSVVVDAPGVTECHLHGVTGLVVKKEADEIASAVTRLLTDDQSRLSMGVAARVRIEEYFSIEASRNRYLALFERLTGHNICVEY